MDRQKTLEYADFNRWVYCCECPDNLYGRPILDNSITLTTRELQWLIEKIVEDVQEHDAVLYEAD